MFLIYLYNNSLIWVERPLFIEQKLGSSMWKIERSPVGLNGVYLCRLCGIIYFYDIDKQSSVIQYVNLYDNVMII